MTTVYDLNDKNFMMSAIKAYNSRNLIMSEFEEDIQRIRYINRLLKRYNNGDGDLKERLILNHITILGNVFGVEFTVRMLFLKIDPEHYTVLKTFLLFLNYMPSVVKSVNGKDIYSADLGIDLSVGQTLHNL